MEKKSTYFETARRGFACALGLAFAAGASSAGAELDMQSRIDAAAAKGGGVVRVPAGEHVAKPFVLKSNVTLELAEGAKLLASTNIADYAMGKECPVFIFADHATNIAIVGKGVIDGRGGGFRETAKLRGEDQPKTLPVLMRFSRCRNVRLEGFHYTNPGSWACHLRNCDGVKVKGTSCFNYCNKMNDGLDIESCNVTVEDCDFYADDDSFCFKAESDRTFPVTNVVVRNCRMGSICNAIKFGTGSYCDFRDITIENCELRRSPGAWRFDWRKNMPGVTNRYCGIAGLALEVVDGGRMENVTIRNIKMEGYMTPIFIRHHHRHEPKGGKVDTYLRNVLIENVKGVADGRIASSITGVPARNGAGPRRPCNIKLRNISLTVPGGGTEAEAKARVPEKDGAYPEAFMFDRKALPAYGFYVRHADNVVFENVKVKTATPDARPEFVIEDCEPAEPPRKDAGQQKIKEWFLENYYGRAPIGRPADMEFKGDEIWIAGGKVKIRLAVTLPKGASREKPCPVVLVTDRRSCFPTPIAPERLKSILAVQDEFRRMAAERGYALVMWNVNDIAPDCWLFDRYIKMKPAELPPNAWGVFGIYGGEPDGRKGDTWGTIRAWAWGHSRVMDWIVSRPELDAKRVAVCGHSRLGKTALVAGVTDERFLVAYSNDSGVGGAHPHRLWKPGVCKLSFVNRHHRHWLCFNSRRFEADERNMPHDMDEFLALMAPRYLYVASASEDAWAGPEGEQFAAEMASRAWERMNLKGWGYRGHVGGHVRPGGHDFTPYDFKLFLDFCATPFGAAARAKTRQETDR